MTTLNPTTTFNTLQTTTQFPNQTQTTSRILYRCPPGMAGDSSCSSCTGNTIPNYDQRYCIEDYTKIPYTPISDYSVDTIKLQNLVSQNLQGKSLNEVIPVIVFPNLIINEYIVENKIVNTIATITDNTILTYNIDSTLKPCKIYIYDKQSLINNNLYFGYPYGYEAVSVLYYISNINVVNDSSLLSFNTSYSYDIRGYLPGSSEAYSASISIDQIFKIDNVNCIGLFKSDIPYILCGYPQLSLNPYPTRRPI
jgi:hypothetical protein